MSEYSVMESICGVIDFDGFHLRRQFLVRECGFISMDMDKPLSMRFDLSPYESLVTPYDMKTIRYVEKYVSGLPFSPKLGEEVFSLECLDSKILELYSSSKTSSKYIIAYKGGNVEKRKLDALEIPCINLERLGCPKFDDLRTANDMKLSCGYHTENLHCPREKVCVFKDWILRNMVENENRDWK